MASKSWKITTIMCIVTSRNVNGTRAKMVWTPIAHIAEGHREPSITSKKLNHYNIGDVIIVDIKAGWKKKYIVRHALLSVSIPDWLNNNVSWRADENSVMNRFFNFEFENYTKSGEWFMDADELLELTKGIGAIPKTKGFASPTKPISTKPISPPTPKTNPVADFMKIEDSEDEKSPEVSRKLQVTSEWIGGYYVPEDTLMALKTAHVVAKERPAKIMAIGGSGYGKTTTAEAFAESVGLEYKRFDVSKVTDQIEFFGHGKAENGTTSFVKSPFTELVTKGNCLIVLDEINRVEPWLTNILFPLLDDSSEIEIENNLIKCGENVIFYCTANIGYEFVGTFEMDSAFSNRIDMTVEVKPLPISVEIEVVHKRTGLPKSTCKEIVNAIGALRAYSDSKELGIDVSTRKSIKVAEMFEAGIMDLQTCFYVVVANTVPASDRKGIIDIINSKVAI